MNVRFTIYNFGYNGMIKSDEVNCTQGANYTADAFSATDYYPFGMQMPGRSFNSPEYRFGFNGQEKDDEITGSTGSHTTAMFWEYDTRIARRWNLDPKPIVGISDYACFTNNPILYSDPLGDLIDGWQNKAGGIMYDDDKAEIGSTKTDSEGTEWKNIGAEIDPKWSSTKQIQFLKAETSFLKQETQDYKELNSILAPIFDISTDAVSIAVPLIGVLKSYYTLTKGSNPIFDFAEIENKEDNIDDAVSNTGNIAYVLEKAAGKPVDLLGQMKTVAKGISGFGLALNIFGAGKTTYDFYNQPKKEKPVIKRVFYPND